VDERSSLLGQLRIDRTDRVETGNRRWVWWACSAVALIGAGAVAWFTLAPPPGVPVQIITAELAPTDVALGPGSILDASGYVVARRKATVSSKITGKVVDVLIEEGQQVETNEIIARLDDTNARAAVAQALAQREQTKANLTAAQVAFDNAVPTFQRNEQQFVRAVISAQTFDTARANYDAARTSLDVAARAVDVAEASLMLAQRNLDDTIVRAPFAGVVTVKAAQEGEMVSPMSAGGGFTRTGIGTVVDMDSLEVEVDVSENFINRVRPDQAVTVKLNAYPDWEIAARVIAIIPTADRAKATVKVRVGFDANDPRILPEMGARVAFLNDAPRDPSATDGQLPAQRAVVIPAEAVQGSGETGVVFVIQNDIVERRTVRLGARSAVGQVVLSGLTSGAQLAVGDFSQLTDGTRVHIEN
jgi:RND family efflux transporter MFP subunit